MTHLTEIPLSKHNRTEFHHRQLLLSPVPVSIYKTDFLWPIQRLFHPNKVT